MKYLTLAAAVFWILTNAATWCQGASLPVDSRNETMKDGTTLRDLALKSGSSSILKQNSHHRQMNEIVAAAAVVKVVLVIVQEVTRSMDAAAKRQQFATITVNELRKNMGLDGFNIVVVYSGTNSKDNKVLEAGIRHRVTGREYKSETVNYKNLDETVVFYAVYYSLKGAEFIFENQGDAGPMNWYYSGEFTRNGNTISASKYDYKVVTYPDINFGGSTSGQAQLSIGEYDVVDGDIPNDSISSIYVPNRFVAFAYEHGGRQGRSLLLPQGRYPAFPNGWNDVISSMEIFYAPDQTGLVPGTLTPPDTIYRPWPPTPVIVYYCSKGITKDKVCCGNATQCDGKCGGSRCERRPGGFALCCNASIQKAGRLCANENDVGCLIP